MIHLPIHWHERFVQQSLWTLPLRDYLFQQINIEPHARILEAGCGTGALLAEMERRLPGDLIGLDLNAAFLRQASSNIQRAKLIQGDARQLPFAEGSFDLAYCHFLLLWVDDPAEVVAEMKRVLCPGGHLLALAEPDYGGRIDYPHPLEQAGKWQTQSLIHQGADPLTGRRLADYFTASGLKDIQTGCLGGEWKLCEAEDGSAEWEILEHDLQFLPEGWDRTLADRLKKLDQESRQRGSRVLFVPVFYAWGQK